MEGGRSDGLIPECLFRRRGGGEGEGRGGKRGREGGREEEGPARAGSSKKALSARTFIPLPLGTKRG